MPFIQRIPRKDNTVKYNDDGFYQSRAWKRLRHQHLLQHPLCYYCSLSGRVTAGNTVDHYRPRRIFPELAVDPANLYTSCEHCHSLKRLFEKGIATKEQFESSILDWLKETYGNIRKN